MSDHSPKDPYTSPGDLEGITNSQNYDDDPLPRRMNFQAIGGLVAGPVIIGPLGIVLSILALRQINKHSDIYFGRGAAIAGIIVGAFATLWQTLFIVGLINS